MALPNILLAFLWLFLNSTQGSPADEISSKLTSRVRDATSEGPSTLPGTWTYYTDRNPRAFGAVIYVKITSMINELCIGFCDQDNYSYAGSEYSQECCELLPTHTKNEELAGHFVGCGNSLRNGAVLAPGGISMLCAANSSEYFGAGNRLDIYQLGYLSATCRSIYLPMMLHGSD